MPRTYADTPIGGAGPEEKVPVPPRIVGLRMVLSDSLEPRGRLFVKAARSMEDYEDDHVYKGFFPQVLRTYGGMDNAQLRGYFEWRGRFRRGDDPSTDYPSYPYTLVCEIVNGVGWRDPAEGYRMLCSVLRAFDDTGWFPHAFEWICDFAACYDVHPDAADAPSSPWPYVQSVRALSRLDALGPEDAMGAIRPISTYDIFRSKTFRLHPDEVREASLLTLRNLDKGWTRVSGASLKDTMFPSEWIHYYSMFPTAVYEDPGDDCKRDYTIDGIAYYTRDHGTWSKATYGVNRGMFRTVGLAMRALDLRLRKRHGIRPLLKPNVADGSWIAACADDALSQMDALRKERVLAGISIDPGNLGRIRRDAEETMERIMTSEERGEDAAETSVPEPQTPEAEGPSAEGSLLDHDETKFLRLLLSGGDWKGFLKGRGLLESVVVDSINSKLYDTFLDIVIEEGDDGPVPIDDYINDLEAIVSP